MVCETCRTDFARDSWLHHICRPRESRSPHWSSRVHMKPWNPSLPTPDSASAPPVNPRVLPGLMFAVAIRYRGQQWSPGQRQPNGALDFASIYGASGPRVLVGPSERWRCMWRMWVFLESRTLVSLHLQGPAHREAWDIQVG